jgi:hypothetical protein
MNASTIFMLLRNIMAAEAGTYPGRDRGVRKRLWRQPGPVVNQLPAALKRFSISAAGM